MACAQHFDGISKIVWLHTFTANIWDNDQLYWFIGALYDNEQIAYNSICFIKRFILVC